MDKDFFSQEIAESNILSQDDVSHVYRLILAIEKKQTIVDPRFVLDIRGLCTL